MKPFFAIVLLLLLTAGMLQAHDVRGKVEVLLKGDRKKSDLSTVILYLDRLEGKVEEKTQTAPKVPEPRFSMSTRSKQFVPRSMAVPVGAKVDFPNYDSIFHNIFSVSSPNDFDLGLYKGGASKTKSFEHAGIVKVFCNVHPQMTATVVVTNSPYFTIADQYGNFKIPLVESGSYMLRAYSDEGQGMQKIHVGEKPITVNITVDGRGFKKIRHKNKFGKDYTSEDERY